MEYAKKDLSGCFRTHHDVCQYPTGKQDGRGVFCGGDAEQQVEGYLFCSLHAAMAERGYLDFEYTDGTTPRGIIESAEQAYGLASAVSNALADIRSDRSPRSATAERPARR